jgi:hypothetical protein
MALIWKLFVLVVYRNYNFLYNQINFTIKSLYDTLNHVITINYIMILKELHN